MKLVLKENQIIDEAKTDQVIVFSDNIKIGNNAMLNIIEDLQEMSIDVVISRLELIGVVVGDSLKHDLYMRQKLIKTSPMYI